MDSVASSTNSPTSQVAAAPSSQVVWCFDDTLTERILKFLPPETQAHLKRTCRTFEAALMIEDKNILTPLKTFAKNLAELVECEGSDCPEEIAQLSREISAILETPGKTFSNKEAQIFIKLIKLSVASFAYLYTKFNMNQYYLEGTPLRFDALRAILLGKDVIFSPLPRLDLEPDKFNAAYASLQNRDPQNTTLLQAQFYRGIVMGHLFLKFVNVKEDYLIPANIVAKELAQKGQLELASRIFDLIPANCAKRKGDFAHMLSLSLANADRPGAACKAARHIHDKFYECAAYEAIWESFARIGGHAEDTCKAMKRSINRPITHYAISSEKLLNMAKALLKEGRLDLVLDFFSYYQDSGNPKRTIPTEVYQSLFQQFDEKLNDYEKTPELEARNQALLEKADELVPLAKNGEHAPVDQWLSELEKRDDQKLCCASIAIQLHFEGAREAAIHYATLINQIL